MSESLQHASDSETDPKNKAQWGSVAYNINQSMQIISAVRCTVQESREIMDSAKMFFETHKMLENSQRMYAEASEQIQRRRKQGQSSDW